MSVEISGFNCTFASLLYSVSDVLKSSVVLSEVACSARNELSSHQLWCVVKNTQAIKLQGVCCLWFELCYADQQWKCDSFLWVKSSATSRIKTKQETRSSACQQSVTSSSSIYLGRTGLNYKWGWVLIEQAIVCVIFLGSVCVILRVLQAWLKELIDLAAYVVPLLLHSTRL